MTVSAAYIFFILLLIRLVFQWNDKTAGLIKNLMMLTIEFLLIMLFVKVNFVIFILFLIIYHFIVYLTEKKMSFSGIYSARIIQVSVMLILFSFSGAYQSGLNDFYCYAFNFLQRNNVFFTNIHSGISSIFLTVACGFLFSINEINNLIRLVLKTLNVEPVKKKNLSKGKFEIVLNKVEFNRGKIIGILERVLIYFFVITGYFASIGFIIAAKAFARFKELDDQDFAEYVLIGTLLSTSLSVFIGFFINLLIN
ncbi:MAG: hypothetical protein JW982_00370 [Spirochaetes bacterium]|nr:hypothetical protein [Spirochaetota bacterium]